MQISILQLTFALRLGIVKSWYDDTGRCVHEDMQRVQTSVTNLEIFDPAPIE